MDLNNLLAGFPSITLKEMDEVSLTNRIDTKYVFHISLLSDILNSLLPCYRILEIDQIRVHPYETLYFDDQELSLYLNHHNQRGSRYKLRLRRYGSSSVSYMEMKRKTNTGRTIKARMKTTAFDPALHPEQESFFREQTALSNGKWDFTTRIKFNRITLVSLNPPERMTLDLQLHFGDSTKSKEFPNLVVAEVKQGSKSPSAFIKEMKNRHIHPFSLSKYCLGLSLLRPEIKQNLFKKQQLIIQQLQDRA
jgi:hypothetical protein